VIAIDDDESGPHASQRISRRLVRLRKVWSRSGKLDGAPKEGGGERIIGKDQYIVSIHVWVPARGSEFGCRDGGVGASKRETIQAAARAGARP